MKRWLSVQLKRSFTNPVLWIVSVLALVLFLIVNTVALHEPQVRAFGLCAKEGVCARSLEEYFLNEETSCPCVIYSDAEAMKRDVLRGKLDCAFEATDNLDAIIFDEIEEQGILYYHTPSTHEGLVIKEKVFACLMQAKSEQILREMAEDGKTFRKVDDQLAEKLLKRQKEYSESDLLFQAQFLTPSGEEMKAAAGDEESEIPHQRVLLAEFLLFAAALAFARERFTREHQSICSALRTKERVFYLVTRVFAQTLPLCLILLIALFVIEGKAGELTGAGGAVRMVFSLAVALILSVLWSAAFSTLFKREIPYLFAMISVLVISYLITVSSVRDVVPALAVIGHLFPTGWLS